VFQQTHPFQNTHCFPAPTLDTVWQAVGATWRLNLTSYNVRMSRWHCSTHSASTCIDSTLPALCAVAKYAWMQLIPGGEVLHNVCTFIVHRCYMFRLHILAILREIQVGSTCTTYVVACHRYAQTIETNWLHNTACYLWLDLQHVSARFIVHLQGVISSEVSTENYLMLLKLLLCLQLLKLLATGCSWHTDGM
jgi:hypothetical protein